MKFLSIIFFMIVGLDKYAANFARPSMDTIRKIFKAPHIIAYSVGIVLFILLIIIWPCVMIPVGVMDVSAFGHWVRLSEIWAFIVASYIIIMPLIQEIQSICKQIRVNSEEKENNPDIRATQSEHVNDAYTPDANGSFESTHV